MPYLRYTNNMRQLSSLDISRCIEQSGARPQLKRKLRPHLILDTMTADSWQEYDYLALPTKDAKAGVLIIQVDKQLYATPYELHTNIGRSSTGRGQAIICDLCKTWQVGTRAGSITFPAKSRALHTRSLLCCADLACSLHVRGKTSAAKTSRAQLRENLTDEQRITRLTVKLASIIEQLRLSPINLKH